MHKIAPINIEPIIIHNQFIDKYDLNLYSEIERLKSENNHGKIGFIELYNYSGRKVRKIEFTTWEFFWNYNFSLVLNFVQTY